MNAKVAELQKSLVETVESKKQLEQALETQEEVHRCAKMEMNAKVAELQKSLAETVETKKLLENQLEEHKCAETEMNAKVAELQKSLLETVETNKLLENQLEEQKCAETEMNAKVAELQKSLVETVETNKLLENQLEEHKCAETEMNAKVAELQKSLVETVETKKLLENQLEEHKCAETEMNAKVAELQKSLVETVESKKQLEQTLDNHQQDHKRVETEMNAKLEQALEKQQDQHLRHQCEQEKSNIKITELQKCLEDAETAKQQLTDTLERQYTIVRGLTVQLQNLSQEHGEVCSKRDELDEKSEELSAQLETMKNKADDLESQCIKLLEKASTQNQEILLLKEDLKKKGAVEQAVDEKDAQLRQLQQTLTEKLQESRKDCEILAGKLYIARTQLEENRDARKKELDNLRNEYEENIREARILVENKMERMKERMKDIHKEKLVKLEDERQKLLVSLEQSYKQRMETLESRCATLQKQVAEMNERDLQNRKENQLLQTKLKTMEESRGERKSQLLLPPAHARLRCNLKMEDEEGEVFNNMFLADLQNGRCTSPTSSDGGAGGPCRISELMRRNSMRLPHLRTTYSALEPEIELPADDTRENVSSAFDDSSTGLITRRKVTGITSYKRPGPPTPSKKAGRLSLGGVLPVANLEIQYKEALQDANVNAGAAEGASGTRGGLATSDQNRTGRTKTPGKFKQMLSSSNLLSNFQRDEVNKNTFFPYYI
ncbi:AGAP000323-PA-like protein [Anopheles sinensis]|uniref:AGAP000323-PA-like protein n=1 Tax=Anopheles sinensis TaxID=74873 RepID=A0A084VJF2_ANOSI|nr:AGAP000323-PA-like protein [Anopheles sinensis]